MMICYDVSSQALCPYYYVHVLLASVYVSAQLALLSKLLYIVLLGITCLCCPLFFPLAALS